MTLQVTLDSLATRDPTEDHTISEKQASEKQASETRLSPPLKWAGGKRWILPTLRPVWVYHQHRRLVEPFCGGLAVTLGLNPERALLNDISPHLINLYHWIQRGLKASVPMVNQQDLYYTYRRRFNQLLAEGQVNSQKAAELFYYLNRTGYNGLCRFNKRGGFNVPFGRYKTINYTVDFSAYRERFQRWVFQVGDFEALELEPDDFIYADPPYDVPFTQYDRGGFNWDDQVRTAEWLARHPGPTLLSNQATDRIVTLYEQLGFRLDYLTAPRMISCTGRRDPVMEVLARRNMDRDL